MSLSTKIGALFTGILTLIIGGHAQENCKPEIDMTALLNNVEVNGSLYVSSLYGRCLPKPAKTSTSAYEYDPYAGGKLSMTLKSSNGQVLNTYGWYARKSTSIWEMNRYEIVGGPQALKKLTPGSYILDFAADDKVFQQFPFSVSTRDSGDQFRPETFYMLDGQWSEYAYLYAPNVDRFFQVGVWLRNDEPSDAKPKAVPFHVRLIRESDKKVLGEDSEGKLNLLPKWQNYKLSFRRPGAAETKDYSEFKLSEILAADGKYRVELTLDGKPKYDYVLNVKGGLINGVDLVQMRKDLYRIMIPLTNERKGR